MESFRAYYEYPSSQAAIHAVPSRIVNKSNVTPTKSKRSWSNILRIRSKKDKDSNTPSRVTYSPGYTATQNAIYATPSYTVQPNPYITSTPYGEVSRRNYYSPSDYGGKFGNYNATYSRASSNPVVLSGTPAVRGTVKNTIRYTDWFGSVVAKKTPIRPALPLFQNNGVLSREGNAPAVTSWDNYVSIQSPPIAVEIPFAIQNYGNFCSCPDQLYATKSKKKKKCKNCGRKIASAQKHATAIGSVARIRPSIPSNFYQSPSPTSWAWPGPTKNHYNQYLVAPIEPRRLDSPPRTPETTRSTSSSSNTLTPDNTSSIKALPPPPTVPLPSIPINLNAGVTEEDRRPSILGSTSNTAYDLIEKDQKADSDTDDLSDNAVNDSWEEFDKLRSKTTNGHRVSIISIGNEENFDPHKVRIYTDDAVTSPTNSENNVSKGSNNDAPKKSSVAASQVKWSNTTTVKENIYNKDNSGYQYNWESAISSVCKRDSNVSTFSSSHAKKQNKNSKKSLNIPERDASKVVNIAGQRILFDQKISVKSFDQNQRSHQESENQPEIGEWEPLHEELISKEVPDLISFAEPEYSPSQDTKLPDSKLDRIQFSNSIRNPENRWSSLSTDTIHEEEEEDNETGMTILENSKSKAQLIEEFEQDNEDKDTISSSSTEYPVRGDGFQPTLSELLQVKSILKRPNSLDTSSETDSDFYLPTFSSEYKKNLRKKKSVQFRQSHDVTLVEAETKGRKVNSIKTTRKEKKKEEASNLADKERRERYNNNWGLIQELSKEENPEENETSKEPEKVLQKESDELFKAIQHHFPELRNFDISQKVSEKDSAEITETDQKNNKNVINKPTGQITNLRRSHSQRDSDSHVNMPTFNDTFRLRQPISRPGIPKFDENRKPTRRAPPPPRNPLRPSVPPPPPPTSKEEDSISSGSSSPPPPLPTSQPPPLPSSSPPPLDSDEVDDLENQEIKFGSFMDPHSAVSISSRTLHIAPVSGINNISDHLSSDIGGSVFDLREEAPKATVRSRMKVASVPNLLAFQSMNGIDTDSFHSSPKAPMRSSNRKNKSPNQRSSFLISMVDEGDQEERFSDHIYEELPSLPSSPSSSNAHTPSPERSMFDGASKYEILEYLQDARKRVNIASEDSDESSELNTLNNAIDNLGLEDEEDRYDQQEDDITPSRYMEGRSSNRSSNSESSDNSGLLRSDKERLVSGEIERTDSGVGSETSKPNVIIRHPLKANASANGLKEGDLPPCDDCESPVEAKVTNSGLMYAPLVCRRCSRRRQERKEILTEIMETEVKYGRDLKVMTDQFYRPMRVAGLLSKNQIDRIFLNIEDLMEHNRQFTLHIKDAFEIAMDQGDEDLLTVNVAKLFLQATPMLHAFQMYCVRQGNASILLQTLEKDRELLRIFLKVSQMENTLLRRMNLHSFLMVPIQRVTKYPLLLARLYKATPPSHPSREDCRRAREKIELYLQHINNETKETSPTKLWRRISMSVGNNSGLLKWSSSPPDYDTSIKLRAVTLEVLDWNAEEAFIVREGRLLCLPPESNNWTRRGRAIKMASVQMVLVTLGRPNATLEEAIPEDGLITPRNLGIKEAAILAFKDHRLTKTALVREPWILSRSVVTWDAEGEAECFEITDLTTKETFIFKDRECVGTEEWFRSTQFHTLSVGSWRQRRKALANIMINGARRS